MNLEDLSWQEMTLSEYAVAINCLHRKAEKKAKEALTFAIEAGKMLLQVKNSLPHGQFMPWVETNLDVSVRQAQRYMRLAKGKPIYRSIPLTNNLSISPQYKIQMNFEDIESRVIAWASARQIIPNSNALSQAIKTAEEVAELLKALNRNDTKEVIDAYGDVLVTLVIGAELYGVNLVACFEAAYDQIKDRKGTLGKDGLFYKDGSAA